MRPFSFLSRPQALIVQPADYSRDRRRPRTRNNHIQGALCALPTIRRAPNWRARILRVALDVRTTGRIGESGGNGAHKQQ
jgi:hypothetical protein